MKNSTRFPCCAFVLSGYSSLWKYRIRNLLYISDLNLSFVCYSLYCAAFLLSVIFLPLSGGKKAVELQQIYRFPSYPQQQRWLQGEAHFPVSRVSQLTKNVSFSLDIKSCLTELKNLLNSQPVDGQEVRRRGGWVFFFVKVGSSGACEAWESARLLVVQKA